MLAHSVLPVPSAERMGLEGVVCKRGDALYRSGSKCGWIKTKTKSWREANKERLRASMRSENAEVRIGTNPREFDGLASLHNDVALLEQMLKGLEPVQTQRARAQLPWPTP